MSKKIKWAKGVLDSSYIIFSNDVVLGNLSFDTWNNHAFGIMAKQSYHFKPNGLTANSTTIYNDKQEKIGEILFHFWQFKAVVHLENEQPLWWQYTNSWLTNWRLSYPDGKETNYIATTGAGTIEGTSLENELAMIAGLYIKESFSRVLSTFIIIIAIVLLSRAF